MLPLITLSVIKKIKINIPALLSVNTKFSSIFTMLHNDTNTNVDILVDDFNTLLSLAMDANIYQDIYTSSPGSTILLLIYTHSPHNQHNAVRV